MDVAVICVKSNVGIIVASHDSLHQATETPPIHASIIKSKTQHLKLSFLDLEREERVDVGREESMHTLMKIQWVFQPAINLQTTQGGQCTRFCDCIGSNILIIKLEILHIFMTTQLPHLNILYSPTLPGI